MSEPGSGGPSTGERKRRHGSRSAKGCITCKIRRVKCDEKKPDCLRCASTGRKCDGYPAADQPWQNFTVNDATALTSFRLSEAPALTLQGNASSAFVFFRAHTAGYLSGLVAEFWDDVILRAAHHSDAILHAVVALGLEHMESTLEEEPSPSAYSRQAVQHYNKAIRSLREMEQTNSPQSLSIVLAVCVLFTCFEIFQWQIDRAISHIRGGIKILAEHWANTTERDEQNAAPSLVPVRQLITAFYRLERQLCRLVQPIPYLIIALGDPPILPDLPANLESASILPRPHFDHLDDAWTSLSVYWYQLMDIVSHNGRIEQETSAGFEDTAQLRRLDVLQGMWDWKTGCSSMIKETKSGAVPEQDKNRPDLAVKNYEVQLLDGIQVLNMEDQINEMSWDLFADKFQQVLDLATVVAEEEKSLVGNIQGNTQGYSQQSFVFQRGRGNRKRDTPMCSMDHGILPILFHVVWKCRDAAVRKNAIGLLERYPRVESLWVSSLIAQVGRRIDEIEREGESLGRAAQRQAKAEEIPAWSRVVGIEVLYTSTTGRTSLNYTKARSKSDVSLETIREFSSW